MLTSIRYLPAPLRRLVVDGAEVPRDLASVTTVATGEERNPEHVGMTRTGVDAIWKNVQQIYATGMHPGISIVVRRHGQIVLKRAIGYAKGNGPGDVDDTPVPMTPDTPVCIFSASKAMAAMTVHLLSELLSRLPPPLQQVALLTYLDGMTAAEIATALDCSTMTVKRRLRALHEQARQLTGLEPEVRDASESA